MKIGAVLMASGLGRRFGSNKLLTAVEGIPLYRRAMTVLAGAGFDRLAVCSPYREVLSAGESMGFLPLYNPDGAEGIAASVRLGVTQMEGMDGVLFSVCDQPFLTTQSIINLINAFQESKTSICALAWQGRRGNPVLFPADLFGELATLTGDRGGGVLIKRHPHRLMLVEAASPRELADIDTLADLPPEK